MPRLKAKPWKKTRPSPLSTNTSRQTDQAKHASKTHPKINNDPRSKGRPREIGANRSIQRRIPAGDTPNIRSAADMVVRSDDFGAPFIPGLMVSSSATPSSSSSSLDSVSSPTSTRATIPIASIHHNVLLILCIVVGAMVVTATLSVGLAWVLRLACCAGERQARRKRRLDRSTWSPTARANGRKAEGRSSLDSVTVQGDDDVETKDAKIDALFGDTTIVGNAGGTVPVLTYDPGKVQEAPKSTWNGKGWTLFDPPVASIQPLEPAAINPAAARSGGGNYGAAREDLADRDIGGFTWPISVERQPSFIERLVQRQHQASELPTTADLPYPFQAKLPQPASRMASLGGAANRAMLNMLPATLRNAATTASRQRATRKRYNDIRPYLDSDFEGTIGAKDRELPMARRLRRTQERMAVDWTTEEESLSPLHKGVGHLQFPTTHQVVITSPMMEQGDKAQAEFTPGLAGVGAAWPRRGSHQSSLAGPHMPVVIRPPMAAMQMPKVFEPNRASLLPFPALEGNRRSRLLGSVGRWLGQVSEAGVIADPYTALSPRPDRRLTKIGSLRSDYTSTTLAASASNSETQIEAQANTSASGRAGRLLERVSADQAEHDRQQRRLLRKARMFTPATHTAVKHGESQNSADMEDVSGNLSRIPSIRPQFFATTDLKSWLEPSKVSTTHGFKVLEEQDGASSVAADPFASDIEVKQTSTGGKSKLTKCGSFDSFVSETRPNKPKLRSSSSKQQLRSCVATSARTGVKEASRQKRETLCSLNTGVIKKPSYDALPSGCQSSAALTVVSSMFDQAFAAQLRKTAKHKSVKGDSAAKGQDRVALSRENAKAQAKAEADAAVRDAWRQRKMLSISSRGSQRSGTMRNTRSCSEPAGVLLSRQESMPSQSSIYSELTAPSDYQFQAPLLSDSAHSALLTSCGASSIDPDTEGTEALIEMPNDVESKREQDEKQRKNQLKNEANQEERRVQRQRAKEISTVAAKPQSTAPPAMPRKSLVPELRPGVALSKSKDAKDHEVTETDTTAQQLAVRRMMRKQRSISLSVARNQISTADVDLDQLGVPDSPWTSSDSDISIRRWGEPGRDDSLRFQNRFPRHQHSTSNPSTRVEPPSTNKRMTSRNARANSYYYGMGAGGDLRDFC